MRTLPGRKQKLNALRAMERGNACPVQASTTTCLTATANGAGPTEPITSITSIIVMIVTVPDTSKNSHTNKPRVFDVTPKSWTV